MKRAILSLQFVIAMFVAPVAAMCSCASADSAVAQNVPSEYNAWLEIDTVQFRRNIDYLKSIIGKSAEICVVMKGDAYGNGISTLMPVVMREGIKVVAITSNQEARDVRNSGYKGRIMRIRLAVEGEVAEAIDLGVEELVGSVAQARTIDRIAAEKGEKVSYHLAVNAGGMSRNGLELGSGMDEALAILGMDNLKCVGMMTHYPANKDGEIRQQLATFRQQTAQLIRRAGLDRSKLMLHTAATYASLYIPETRMDMVRVGSALYNYGYTETFGQFKKIMSFKSRVASVQDYPAGNTVSYKRTHRLSRKSRLANIPVGYSNGLSASVANRGFVLIRGHRCPIVGNVTMNITMVDVTDCPDVEAGDEVVIYGRQGKDEITAADIAAWSGQNLLSQSMFWSSANPKVAVEER
ncbi:MAG: alanine racemase [Bacteroidaceae bacterium]|nr:alanine racemase [Bacteroidaceae bacterium]